MDCPPSLGLLTVNALTAAQRVLIPIQCEYYALEGVSSLMNTVNRVKHAFNPGLDIEGVLLTMLDARTNLGIQVVDSVKKHFKSRVFATAIPRNVRLGEAPSHGLPIHLYDPRSLGADSYRRLAQEFLQRKQIGVGEDETRRTRQRPGCAFATERRIAGNGGARYLHRRDRPNASQPRRDFDKEALEQLADSIREAGVLSPILVVENGMRYRHCRG